MMKYLFSYGTLQRGEVQLELFGRMLEGNPDLLRGYTTANVEIKDESFLAKGEQKYQQTLRKTGSRLDSVAGTVFEVTDEELLKTDGYEPEDYERSELKLESGKHAWIYRRP